MTNPAERQRGHSSLILPIATLLVSLAATYFAYKSADYAEESAEAAAASAETAEQIRIQDVESRQFAARADSSWTITIEQVAGPHYLLKTVHLSPEYQVSDGETTGNAITIALEQYRDRSSQIPRYVIPNVDESICRLNGYKSPTGNCKDLLLVDLTILVYDREKKIRVDRS